MHEWWSASCHTKEVSNVPIVGEENTRVSIYIGPWVLGFSCLQKNLGCDRIDLADHLEERVIGKMLEREFTLGAVAWIL